jgi:alpha-N-arabinofuranosidase
MRRFGLSRGLAGAGLLLLALGALGAPAWAAEPQPLNIEAARIGQPMSKYIYGQFTEHLGRCIYGGIWAEMLEDRKFYYPVTDAYKPFKMNPGDKNWDAPPFPELVGSPWRVIGGKGFVSMVKDKPFVGEQTPELTLPGDGKPRGIEQPGLGLIKGKEYAGHIWLAGDPAAAPVRVSLVWGRGTDKGIRKMVIIKKITPEWTRAEFKFTAGDSTDDGRLTITSRGKGAFKIGTVSLMPADNVQGFRADTLELLKQLDSLVYRWPGGNFVSGYDWRDGLGDRDRRPPRKNPAWTGVEPNDVGIHEFMEFCKLIGTEPYIAVNTGKGTPAQAGEEVEYCNGAAATPLGKLRAQNGHPAPYGVKWWSAGNEMFGNWQIGHMPLDQYVKKHNAVAEAMKKADASIKIIAVGEVGRWDQAMLKECADHMDLISEHFYCKSKPELAAHVAQIPNRIRQIAEAHRKYRQTIPELKGKDIRIAMDEWNYWYGPYIYGELGTQYFLQDALGIAAGLNEYSRQSDIVFMANYAQTVNVIGAIKTSKTAAALDSTGVVLALYRKQFGTLPVAVSGVPKPYDVAAAWTEDKKALTISVVNPTPEAAAFKLGVAGAKLAASGKAWVVTGPSAKACNIPGKAPQVTAKESEAQLEGGALKVEPLSATVFRFEVQ